MTFVRDGDTLEFGGMAIRLQGLAAPDADESGGAEASEAMRQLVEGRRLRCESHGDRTHDRASATSSPSRDGTMMIIRLWAAGAVAASLIVGTAHAAEEPVSYSLSVQDQVNDGCWITPKATESRLRQMIEEDMIVHKNLFAGGVLFHLVVIGYQESTDNGKKSSCVVATMFWVEQPDWLLNVIPGLHLLTGGTKSEMTDRESDVVYDLYKDWRESAIQIREYWRERAKKEGRSIDSQ